MFGIVLHGQVDIGALIWDNMVDHIPDISNKKTVSYQRFWCAIIANVHAKNNSDAATGDGPNIPFSQVNVPKFSAEEEEQFLFVSKLTHYMLKQVPSDNTLIQAYLADPVNAFQKRPEDLYTDAVVQKASKKTSKRQGSVISPKKTKKSKSATTSEEPEDLIPKEIPTKKRNQKKQTRRKIIRSDSEETEFDDSIPLSTMMKNSQNKPPPVPKSPREPSLTPSSSSSSQSSHKQNQQPPSPPKNTSTSHQKPPTPEHNPFTQPYILQDNEGIFPELSDSPLDDTDDMTFVVKKDFTKLFKLTKEIQSQFASARMVEDLTFKPFSTTVFSSFKEVSEGISAIQLQQNSHQQLLDQHSVALTEIQRLSAANQQLLQQQATILSAMNTMMTAMSSSVSTVQSTVTALSTEVASMKTSVATPASVDHSIVQTLLNDVVVQLASIVAPILPALAPLQRLTAHLPGVGGSSARQITKGGEGADRGEQWEEIPIPPQQPLIIDEGAGGSTHRPPARD